MKLPIISCFVSTNGKYNSNNIPSIIYAQHKLEFVFLKLSG